MKLGLFLALSFATTASPALSAGFEVLAPHRAVYEVKLENAEDRSGIKAMTGRIVYETRGSACEGMSINYRFVTRISTGSDTFVTDQQSASYESADGSEFSFLTRSFVNERADQRIEGAAARKDEGIAVSLTGKEPRNLSIEDGIFTSTHLVAVIESALNGETFVTHDVFDGSGEADKVLRSASVIGKPRIVEKSFDGETALNLQPLEGEQAWPVTMSYFQKNQDNSAEGTPIYEASFLLYRNGVSRNLLMRYPDYSLKATLSELEILDQAGCE